MHLGRGWRKIRWRAVRCFIAVEAGPDRAQRGYCGAAATLAEDDGAHGGWTRLPLGPISALQRLTSRTHGQAELALGAALPVSAGGDDELRVLAYCMRLETAGEGRRGAAGSK